MSWKMKGSDRELSDDTFLKIPGKENGILPVVKYFGKKDALIGAGIVTERMLRLDPVDNGFGITSDDFGNDVTFIEDYCGPDTYFVTKYLANNDREADKKDHRSRSIDQVDISAVLARIVTAGG